MFVVKNCTKFMAILWILICYTTKTDKIWECVSEDVERYWLQLTGIYLWKGSRLDYENIDLNEI